MSKQKFFIYLLVVVMLTALVLGFLQRRPKYGDIVIGGKKLRVELVDTKIKRQKGLSGREKFKNEEGMLFLSETGERHGIWMKNMKFPIDIIWINNGKVVDMISRISQNDQETVYYSREEYSFVLEVNAGFVEENGIKVGDNVDIFL